MLLCIGSVIDQRRSKCDKNISDTLGYASCATFLTSSVIYYWTDTRQHGIYLLNVSNYPHKRSRSIV